MVEAFAMMAGTALEYGVRMLACLQTEREEESEHPIKLVFAFSATAANLYFLFPSFIQWHPEGAPWVRD